MRGFYALLAQSGLFLRRFLYSFLLFNSKLIQIHMANFCFTFFIKKLPFRSASTFFLQLEFYFSLHILQHPTIFKEFAKHTPLSY
jgi:hypothetical protein